MRLFVFFLDPYVGIWVLLLAYAMQLGLCTDPWIQMGTDIADDAGCSGYTWSGSNFGSVVSSSGDGSRLAVSRASNYVRVYEWSDATNWTQSSELAIQTNDLGSSMQISRDGTHIAIGGGGKVAVYEYKSNAWTLKGSFLQSENNPHNGFGDAVSISDDGTRLAVGEPQHGNNPFNCTNEAAQGAARVYEWNTGQSSWDKMGSNFFCHNKTDDKVGHSNSISGDGNRVAVGAPETDGPEQCDFYGCYSTSPNRGQVRIYEWSNVANAWQVMGDYIDGSPHDGLGSSVSMSRDGSRVMVGVPLHDTGCSNGGTAFVYEWDSTSWVRMSSDMTATCEQRQVSNNYGGRYARFGDDNNFGTSVSILADGSHVAVGSGTRYQGEVRVYEWKSGVWSQIGTTMDNYAEEYCAYNDNSCTPAYGCSYMPEFGFGNSVSISQDSKGTRVFVGMPRNVEVRVLRMTTCDDPVTAPEYGSMGDCRSSLPLGTTCQFGCNTGYSLSGMTKCSEAGVLSSAKCTKSWTVDAFHIDKVSDWSNFGGSVAISGDGKRVASAARENGGLMVYVYERVPESSSWQQVSDGIFRNHNADMYWQEWSQYVSLSKDGFTVAVGYAEYQGDSSLCRVFEWKIDTWTQLGGDIASNVTTEYFGQTVSLADDGRRVAVGSTMGSISGKAYVRVYELQENKWVQMGMPIPSNTYFQQSWMCGSYCSASVSLTGDGNMIAVGFHKSNVTVHRWVSESGWLPVGAAIDVSEFIGHSALSLSDDGSRVVVGHRGTSWSTPDIEYAKVFKFDSTFDLWRQIGANIQGGVPGEYFGRSVSISGNGSRVAIGGPSARHFTSTITSDTNYGVVRVYDWVSDDWVQQGVSVYGFDMPSPAYTPQRGQYGNGYGSFGASVSISDDGSSLAVGERTARRVNLFKVPAWTQPAPPSSEVADAPTNYTSEMTPGGSSNEDITNTTDVSAPAANATALPPSLPSPPPSPSPPTSLVLTDYESSASRYSFVIGLVVSIINLYYNEIKVGWS